MLFERRVNLPIEIVQQGGEAPLVLIGPELPGIRLHARFNCQRVLAESFAFGEFAQNVPGLFAVEHRDYDIPASPHDALRAARKRSRSRFRIRSERKPAGVHVSISISPGWWRGWRTMRAPGRSTASRASAT